MDLAGAGWVQKWKRLATVGLAVGLAALFVYGVYLLKANSPSEVKGPEALPFRALTGEAFPFVTFGRGAQGEPPGRGGVLVIRDAASFQEFWEGTPDRRWDTPPPLPVVDFARSTVIVVGLGWQNISYRAEVVQVLVGSDRAIVRVREQSHEIAGDAGYVQCDEFRILKVDTKIAAPVEIVTEPWE